MPATAQAVRNTKIDSTFATFSENSEFSGKQIGGSQARLRSAKLRRDMEISRNSTEIELPVLTCLRCRHTWHPRRPNLPAHCANCCSPYWNKPRQRLRTTPEPTEKHSTPEENTSSRPSSLLKKGFRWLEEHRNSSQVVDSSFDEQRKYWFSSHRR